MIVYPAIDIKDGKCVRLLQGNYDEVTVYGENPKEMAKKWETAGAEFLHIVDLDGARSGDGINRKIAFEIAEQLSIPVQLGGGIRSQRDIDEILDSDINRVILGTAAVNNPSLVKEVVKKYGKRIVVGIDAKDGFVAVEGWEKVSSFKAIEFAKMMEDIGVCTIIYTDISRDGMLKGPNVSAMKEMTTNVKIDIIASGGVSMLQDLIDLKATDVQGAIVGKALYAGRLNLQEAILALK